MKALLTLFSIEHVLMCTPMFILCSNIQARNRYLESELYGQLYEEQVTIIIKQKMMMP